MQKRKHQERTREIPRLRGRVLFKCLKELSTKVSEDWKVFVVCGKWSSPFKMQMGSPEFESVADSKRMCVGDVERFGVGSC